MKSNVPDKLNTHSVYHSPTQLKQMGWAALAVAGVKL